MTDTNKCLMCKKLCFEEERIDYEFEGDKKKAKLWLKYIQMLERRIIDAPRISSCKPCSFEHTILLNQIRSEAGIRLKAQLAANEIDLQRAEHQYKSISLAFAEATLKYGSNHFITIELAIKYKNAAQLKSQRLRRLRELRSRK